MRNLFALVFLPLFTAAAVLGQDAVRVKAGDRAPEIDWTKIVQSPESAKYQPNLAGQFTVLQFLPVTPNAQAVGEWNDLIAKLADRPVQFIWITDEPWPKVEPFLREHRLNGWLLVDEKREIARAYGIETGGPVIVEPSGKIAGFTMFLQPEQLSAVLEGKGRLDSEPERLPSPAMPQKPDIAPSYEVHISPSPTNGTDGSSGPDFWVQRGFDLKAMVAMVYEKDLSRVVLPKSLDNDSKFDFVVVLPRPEDEKTIHRLVQRAIETQFKVSAVVEQIPTEVYVMTAIKGKTPPAKTGPESLGGGSTSSSGFEFSLPAGTPDTAEAVEKAVRKVLQHPENIGISSISAANTTMNEFRRDLEQGMGRPIVDETGLKGVYDLQVHGDAKNTDEFIRNLREQTGLVLTPAIRSIEMLTLRSLN